jgi:L-iditol 2-dehydrogenase
VPAGAIVHKVPSTFDPQQGALIEPLACAIHAVNLGNLQFGDVVVVSGLGAIGMGVLQVARRKTPGLLIGLDVDDALLSIASQLGADHVYNPASEDALARLRSLTENRGPDIYIEASGSVASLETGIQALRKGGRLVIYGVYGRPTTLDPNLISEFKELQIAGGHVSPNTYPIAIQLLDQGLIDWRRMVTQVFPLAQFERAIQIKGQPGAASIKTLLIP